MRRLVADSLRADPALEVVGEAVDGDEAREQCARLQPDVLTLDLAMPGTNGLQVLEQLQADRSPVRVVVVSSFSASLVERALDVLDAGATDLVAKPKVGEGFDEFAAQLRSSVHAASLGRRRDDHATEPAAPRLALPRSNRSTADHDRVLVIASSTGGPRALGEVVPRLGGSVGGGSVLVQHMPEGFTAPLARRLDQASALRVREARDGDRIEPMSMLVAPAGTHLRFDAAGVARLDRSEPIGGLRPRADVTIEDLVEAFGARVVLVVLTGMGSDALAGARRVRSAGGIVLAQDESDCVVYGMPRAVAEADLVDAVGTLGELPDLVERALATPVAGDA